MTGIAWAHVQKANKGNPSEAKKSQKNANGAIAKKVIDHSLAQSGLTHCRPNSVMANFKLNWARPVFSILGWVHRLFVLHTEWDLEVQ